MEVKRDLSLDNITSLKTAGCEMVRQSATKYYSLTILVKKVLPAGFEPATCGLGIRRSILAELREYI